MYITYDSVWQPISKWQFLFIFLLNIFVAFNVKFLFKYKNILLILKSHFMKIILFTICPPSLLIYLLSLLLYMADSKQGAGKKLIRNHPWLQGTFSDKEKEKQLNDCNA